MGIVNRVGCRQLSSGSQRFTVMMHVKGSKSTMPQNAQENESLPSHDCLSLCSIADQQLELGVRTPSLQKEIGLHPVGDGSCCAEVLAPDGPG